MNIHTIFGLMIVLTGISFYTHRVFIKKDVKCLDVSGGSVLCLFLVLIGSVKILINV